MTKPRVKLTMLEEAGKHGQPSKKPRRIVKLVKDGEETTYLIPEEGDPVAVIELKHIPADEFQKLWEALG